MKPMSTMNVIPFIDVMLVLLAIVLTTATFVAQGRIPVRLPTAASADPPAPLESVEIAIVEDGSLFVDGQKLEVDGFGAFLSALDQRTKMLLRVDERVAFRHFVAVIDGLKAAQLNNVSIVTKRAGL